HARISHVHAKDVRAGVMAQARRDHLSFLDAVIAGVFTVPGDGCVGYREVFRELPGYAGWVVVEAEQDPAQAHPLTYAKLGCKNHYRVGCGVGTPRSGIAPGAAGAVERVIAGESLLAVVVRSVLLELNIIRAPTMKAIEATAASALQPEPVSSNGTLVCRGLFRKDSSYGVMRGKFG